MGDFLKKVLYTGAASGIAARVIEKIKNDYFIYVTVHNSMELKRVKEKYKNEQNIICFKLDITNDLDLETVKKLDIDILINNAAISNGGSIINMDLNLLEQVFETNVFGTFKLTQIVIQNMLKKGSGKIINMSSLAGLVPISFIGPYSASKASITNLSIVLQKELSLINDKIRIIIIEPGVYKTGFNEYMFLNKYNDNFKEYFDDVIYKIKSKEVFIQNYIELKNYKSIVNKIVKAINSDNQKTIYKAPLIEAILAKIYVIFKK